MLSKQGFWVTFFTPKQHVGSQPADLIAIINNKAILIDCKTCATRYFNLSRIEENQRQAYKKYKACGNTRFILAIKYNNRIYEVNLNDIDFTQKSIDLEGGRFAYYSIEQYTNN